MEKRKGRALKECKGVSVHNPNTCRRRKACIVVKGKFRHYCRTKTSTKKNINKNSKNKSKIPTPKIPTPKIPTPKIPTPKTSTPKIPTPKIPTPLPKTPTPKIPTPKTSTSKIPTPKIPTPKITTPKTLTSELLSTPSPLLPAPSPSLKTSENKKLKPKSGTIAPQTLKKTTINIDRKTDAYYKHIQKMEQGRLKSKSKKLAFKSLV